LQWQLIFMLSFADTLNNFSYFIGNPDYPSGACTFQAIIQQVSSYTFLFW